MATLKSQGNLSNEAGTLAGSFEFVYYNDTLYMPVDYIDGDTGVVPSIERKTWVPMSETQIMEKARDQFDTMFKDPSQLRNFCYMVSQAAQSCPSAPPWLLIKTDAGMKVLREDGTLHDPDGTFVPNTINWTLNEDKTEKAALLSTISDWVGGDQEIVTSLLRHLATALAPHWSANKYVLLIGNGRNGKSLLMNMLMKLFGQHNCSSVTRQQMSEADKSLFDLNNKLLNIVFDGPADFVKDSGREKSLITGETVAVRKLYANAATDVQTNALFIEGLNQEPRSRDKSGALQARLVRFWFPNRYADDQSFWTHMHSERMLGALLSLLIDHYVLRSEIAVMLAPSQASREAQIEHSIDNSLAFQFLLYLDETEMLPVEEYLLGMMLQDLLPQFQAWRKACGDTNPWDAASLPNLFKPALNTERKSTRINGKPRKARVILSLTDDAMAVVESMRAEDAHAQAVAED